MDNDAILLTQTGYDLLRARLTELQQQLAANQTNLADVQDPTDSMRSEAAYDDAEDSAVMMQDRVRTLEQALARAQIIATDAHPTQVQVGDLVTVRDMLDNKPSQFDLMSSVEAVAVENGVSVDSPVGKALLNHRVGDVVDVDIPDGKVHYAIMRIEPSKR